MNFLEISGLIFISIICLFICYMLFNYIKYCILNTMYAFKCLRKKEMDKIEFPSASGVSYRIKQNDFYDNKFKAACKLIKLGIKEVFI